ncbi:unnamed protein product [Leptidea sinapis]|uniref:G-protein coupled receptors family 2 profile 2 domain-containing protein n=1 Tax=Leptidea sinapis TaxID=189913 RepID=A0A5E4QD31_9NEOP|nr:unnamed protein product [Leptidea sinapis]
MIFCIVSLGWILAFAINTSYQSCVEEIIGKGLKVTWPESSNSSYDIKSNPVCYDDDKIVTRSCVNDEWIPSSKDLKPCKDTLKLADTYGSPTSCPPSFEKISEKNNDYCYQIQRRSSWSYPCLQSGGASITHLDDDDVFSLLESLRAKNISRYFWLPARRANLFTHVTWFTPGQMWGRTVESQNLLQIQASIFKSCLLLDIELSILITELCIAEYPSLCFFANNINYPAKCPKKYHGVRYTPDESICFGIEVRNTSLTFEDFHRDTCTLMGDRMDSDLSRYIYTEIAQSYDLSDDIWCWFSTSYYIYTDIDDYSILKPFFSDFRVIVNNKGSIKLTKKSYNESFPCMACRTQVLLERTEISLEYDELDKRMYLTIYYPSGLWRYNENDTGIQCFSDAKGFVKVIEINKIPFINVSRSNSYVEQLMEKTVFIIDLITDRSAQYWCEGHTKNFSLISTEKIIVSPQGNDVHVFSLALSFFITDHEIQQRLDEHLNELVENITYIFDADKVLPMDIVDYALDKLHVIFHLHIEISNIDDDKGMNIKRLYEKLNETAYNELPKYNYTLENLASSIYCLPVTSSSDNMILDWELTEIGHIAAPKQFCLQGNGLPVKRLCDGSYITGSTWGDVRGVCKENYSPSTTTTLLYNFLTGNVPEKAAYRFLTQGLGTALADTGIIIPADIFYLSISLTVIVDVAQRNETLLDMGNIDNIAWIMNRIMILDKKYLQLSQTLNSTNVILDTIGKIIEILTKKTNCITPQTARITHEVMAREPEFIIQVCYPYINNVTGVAIRSSNYSSDFKDVDIIPLHQNTTIEEILMIEDLEIATWIPHEVIENLINKRNDSEGIFSNLEDVRIIITVFKNDAVFQEIDSNNLVINSRIISVAIPGLITNLENPITLIFKSVNNLFYKRSCGYWDFNIREGNSVPGHWSEKGCYLVQAVNHTTVCECYHLTHFGQLINIRERREEDSNIPKNTKTLNIISLIGSFLSLSGIMGIWITATVFQAWRKKPGTKILINLTGAIAIPLIIIAVYNLGTICEGDENGIIRKKMRVVCIILGALLHYSVLASFMWMLIAASLQFIRYVRVFGVYRPSRFMVKFTLIGWGIPVLPVGFVLLNDRENYIPDSMTCYEQAICYPKVICAISRGPDGKVRSTDMDLIGAQLRLSIFLFFLLGLTWVFVVNAWRAVPANQAMYAMRSHQVGRQSDDEMSELIPSISDENLPRDHLNNIYKFGHCTKELQNNRYFVKSVNITFPTWQSSSVNYIYLLEKKRTQKFKYQCIVMKMYVPWKYLFYKSRLPLYYCQGYIYYLMMNTINKYQIHEFYLYNKMFMPANFVFEFYHGLKL